MYAGELLGEDLLMLGIEITSSYLAIPETECGFYGINYAISFLVSVNDQTIDHNVNCMPLLFVQRDSFI